MGFRSFPFSLACSAGFFSFALVATIGFEPLDMGNSLLMGSDWFVLLADLHMYMYNKEKVIEPTGFGPDLSMRVGDNSI